MSASWLVAGLVANSTKVKELEAEIRRLRAAGNAAFFAMCYYRENGDLEVFQDAIDALGVALEGK